MKYRPTPPLRLLRYLARSVEANGFRKTLVDFCQRLFHSLRDRGIDGTLQRAVSKPTKIPKGATFLQPHPFDLIHGTDTGGYIPGAELSAISLSAVYSTAYLDIRHLRSRKPFPGCPHFFAPAIERQTHQLPIGHPRSL